MWVQASNFVEREESKTMPQSSIAMLVSNGTLRKVPWGGVQDAANRTTHDFTIDDCLTQLTSYTEKTKELMKSKIAPALKLFNGSAINDPSKIFALQKVAKELKDQRIVPLSEAIRIFYDQRQRFLDIVAKHFHPGLETTYSYNSSAISCDLYSNLPLVAVPWRAAGQAGVSPLLLMPDIPVLDDDELRLQLHPALELRRLQEQRTAMSTPLTAEDYALLKRAMPPEMSAVTDALIYKFGGTQAVEALGIGMSRAATAGARLDDLVKKTLPQAMLEAHAAAHLLLTKRSGLSDDRIAASLRTATTKQFRAIVEKQALLRDQRFASHMSLLKQVPELLDLLRACVAAGHDVVYKQNGETPVDEMLIERCMHGSGGQLLRMQTILNSVLADRGLSVGTTTVAALLKQAGIKALAVKHTLNPPKVGKHFCCAEIRSHRQIAFLFSAYCVRVSIDQKANMKSNSDHNTAEGGNRKKYQISSERT